MPFSHLILILLVVFIWGINFLFLKLGLEEIPPLLLCALRFIFASIPAIFFIKPPKTSLKLVMAYGLITFALQFSLLFLGITAGMTAGMASLIAQMQGFFSLLFAAIFLGEKVKIWQIIGGLLALCGICVAGFHTDGSMTLSGSLLILAAAAAWGFGNLLARKLNQVNALSLIVWGSFLAALPMLGLSLLFEGPERIMNAYQELSIKGLISLAYIVYLSTWVGYGLWNWLLSKYPVSIVVPFTPLVPVIGMLSSIILLNEPMQNWKFLVFLLVVSGLCLSLLGESLFKRLKAKAQNMQPDKTNQDSLSTQGS